MADILTALSTGYINAGSMSYSSTKYVPVDSKLYEGSWTGKYGNNKAFAISISNVQGFRATVKYESGSTVNYSQVLIKDSQFRVGDTKFLLTGQGKAVIATATTDPVTGNVSVRKAIATQG